jgi:hypothetical protein
MSRKEESMLIKNKINNVVFILISAMLLTVGCSKENGKGTTGALDGKEDGLPGQSELGEAEVSPVLEEENASDAETKEEPALSSSEKKVEQAKEILKAHMEKNLTYAPLVDPEDTYNLNIVKNIHMIAVETGEYSINKTKSNYRVGGTDLGISFNQGENTYIAFGDTFLNECMEGGWRSNVMAVTTDKDYTDGILFDYMVTNPGVKTAKELIPSKKIDNTEMTTIPTGGIAIGETLYLSYMSVRHWGTPGGWDCNYGSIAKSEDNGQTWEPMETLRWPGDSSFCQMAPVIEGDYVYILGITGGRRGPAKLMRVPVSEYENYEAYEYLMEYDEEDNPIYETGEKAMYEAYNILPKAVGEMSVLYSEYLEEWLVTYIDGKGDLVVKSSKNIYGPYSKPVIIAAQKDFPSLYGAFMNPKWVSEDGKKIAFMMSIFDPVYNTVLMEMELER